jgi:hypothetical protein
MKRAVMTLALSLLTVGTAWSKDIAVCAESDGYSYFPNAGLLAISSSKDAGKWHEDAVSPGRFTLSTGAGEKLDLFYTDASGRVGSATSNGAEVIRAGQTKDALAVIVIYPGKTVETFTFVNSQNGPEAIWSSNKYGTPILKISAFHASCSLLDLE